MSLGNSELAAAAAAAPAVRALGVGDIAELRKRITLTYTGANCHTTIMYCVVRMSENGMYMAMVGTRYPKSNAGSSALAYDRGISLPSAKYDFPAEAQMYAMK